MRKASATILALFLFGATAHAQTASEQRRADYSRETLTRLFVASGDNLRFSEDAVDFRALGTSFHLNIPRVLAPLSGSVMGVTQTWPDPFALTNTQIATSRRAWRTQRAISSELRRIEATERARVRVVTR
ncbi:MAG TPA: hypothetical protein VEK11_05025 [Thermoanaerobaculia bacterium]|nr:hypothetical protein [Thermoanaerobaculia bacterium]